MIIEVSNKDSFAIFFISVSLSKKVNLPIKFCEGEYNSGKHPL